MRLQHKLAAYFLTITTLIIFSQDETQDENTSLPLNLTEPQLEARGGVPRGEAAEVRSWHPAENIHQTPPKRYDKNAEILSPID